MTFPSESHSHEAPAARSNSSENAIQDLTLSNDQDPDNYHNQIHSEPNIVSNIHLEFQDTSEYSGALENNKVQNQNPKITQTTPKINPSNI